MRRLSFERSRCLACRSCEIACVVAHSQAGTLAGAIREAPAPHRRVTVAAGPGGAEALRCEQCGQVDARGSDVYRKLVFRGDHLVGELLYGDVSHAGEFYRRYREAAARPSGAERG